MKLKIRPTDLCGVFLGSEAVATGALTAEQLGGPQFRRLFRDVYLPAGMPMTHPVRCEGAALVLPPAAVITGRSAATLRVTPLARATDPVEIVVPLETRIARRTGLDVRRSELTAGKSSHGRGSAWRRRCARRWICCLIGRCRMQSLTWTPCCGLGPSISTQCSGW